MVKLPSSYITFAYADYCRLLLRAELEVSSESLLCVHMAHSNRSICMMLFLHEYFKVCRGALDNVMVLMI